MTADSIEAATILVGDCLESLQTLPDGCVHCCVTSPPYWGLRDYGTASWDGGDPGCDHLSIRRGHGEEKQSSSLGTSRDRIVASDCRCGARRVDRQIGIEPTPEEYVAKMVAVFSEVRRVLRDDGTLWLNLGDSYNAHPGQRKTTDKVGEKQQSVRGASAAPSRSVDGLKPKDLVGIPWRVAFALQADGWWLRQDIIWHKPAPMPESVTDRCTKAHEYLFLLSKSERYHFDHKAIAEPATTAADATCRSFDRESEKPPGQPGPPQKRLGRSGNTQRRPASDRGVPVDTGGRTNGAVAGSVPWQGDTRNRRSVWTVATQPYKDAHFATFPPKLIEPCILAGCPAGGTVLDPFLGSGTTAAVAIKHGRKAIGCELNPKYVKMAKRRIASEITVFHLD